ncbi:MAG: DMT family transporter [Dehalococcoidia bacterium]
MTLKQGLILIALSLVWGCSFLFIKVIVDAGVEPMGMSAVRTTLGAATLVPFAWAARDGFRQPRATWLALLGLGVLNFAIPWTIFGIAETHVPSGAAAVANASMPLWSALLATILLRADRLGPQRIAGLGLGFLGVVVLMSGDLTDLSGSEAGSILLILVATFCYGASAVSIRRWLGHVPSIPLASAQVTTAAALLVPAALLTGAYSDADITFKVVANAAALGAFGSGLAVVGYMYLIQSVGPVRASVVTYMVPPIGVVLGWLFLDESIGWNLVAALGFIPAGVALVQGTNVRRFARRSPLAAPIAAAGD